MQFLINGEWHTWINYERFHELAQNYMKTGETFSALDYVSKTPAWAVIGSSERGFDPQETRHYRKSKKATQAPSATESESPPSR